jgi:formate/nitrite transporter FocA (FNT family)
MGAPEPEEIFENTRKEGERRLERPFLEVVSTALAAGFDIAAGVILLAVLTAQLTEHFGKHAASVGGALGFGVGFVFLIVGRGELFTENFLVPLAGLDGKERNAWWKVAELWTVSPVFNIVAGGCMGVLLSIHSVLPFGSGQTAVRIAETVYANGTLARFVSALFAGALVTAIAGALLALGSFNHVIVITLELVLGIRYGAHVPWSFVVGNFFLAAAGNLIGGVGLVTLNRFTQARSGKTVSG